MATHDVHPHSGLAVRALDRALGNDAWSGSDQLLDRHGGHGKQLFDEVAKAVHELDGVGKDKHKGNASALQAMAPGLVDDLYCAVGALSDRAYQDGVARDADPKALSRAQQASDSAAAQRARGRVEQAIRTLGRAWRFAVEARPT